MNPYSNKGNIRTFSKDVNKLELVWHQDAEDRDIEILEGKGWEMQFDNELPFAVSKGRSYIYNRRSEYTEYLKGTTDLKIKIN
jgi:hypothetical protein